jgi:hypothetical protein
MPTTRKAADGANPMHLICHLQLDRLRAWKKYSLRADLLIRGRLHPQAYSSWSSVFKGLLSWHEAERKKKNKPIDTTLWVVTSHRVPGQSRKRPSIVARIDVAARYQGDDRQLSAEMQRYVRQWIRKTDGEESKRSEKKELPKELCTIVEAKPSTSRFFPTNDFGPCLNGLRYVNRDGDPTDYNPRSVLRVHPDDVPQIHGFARRIARKTVFISYKQVDFLKPDPTDQPPWSIGGFGHQLTALGYGVWLDALCVPRRPGKTDEALTDDQVELLLAEGYLQSRVVVAVRTPKYDTPGVKNTNWTRKEYRGHVGAKEARHPMKRFVLHGTKAKPLSPAPHDSEHWSSPPGKINDKLLRLLRR